LKKKCYNHVLNFIAASHIETGPGLQDRSCCNILSPPSWKGASHQRSSSCKEIPWQRQQRRSCQSHLNAWRGRPWDCCGVQTSTWNKHGTWLV